MNSVKRKFVIEIVLMLIAICLSIVAIVLRCIPKSKGLSAKEIYDNCIYNVVEVKAVVSGVGESYGTGVIVSDDGRIITNAHVVTYETASVDNYFDEYYVRFSYSTEYVAVDIIKYDTTLDLAILKLKSMDDIQFNAIKIKDNQLSVGERVYAVGNASNYGIGIFEGVVSVPLVSVELDDVTRRVIQCDLTIAAGNSGGALIDNYGRLAGITTFRTKDNIGNVIYGIVYCIPVSIVQEYI